MAELLIKAKSNTHPDAEKDRKGCWKKGMIVVVRPDGFAWGSEELRAPADGGAFVRVRLTGVPVSKVEKYLQREPDMVTPDRTYRRRIFRILVDNLPAGVINTLNNTGFYATTWTAVRKYVERITTREVETGVIL